MPRVPNTFVPEVAQSSGGQAMFQAENVQIGENLAARQAVEMGSAVRQFGGAMLKASSEIESDVMRMQMARQDKIDEAEAKNLETQFLQSAFGIVDGDGGYMGTLGKAAEDRYQSVQTSLSDAAQTVLGAAKTDMQRRMLAPAIARHAMTFERRAAEHRDKQVRVYYGNEAKARSAQFVGLAVNAYRERGTVDADGSPAGEFHANLVVALDEIHKYGEAAGIPEGSAQMRDLERGVYSATVTGVASRLAMDKNYQGALEFVKAHADAGNLDVQVADKLLADLFEDRRRQTVFELTDSIKARGILAAPSAAEQAMQGPAAAEAEERRRFIEEGEPAPTRAIDEVWAPPQENAQTRPPTMREALEIASKIEDPDVRRAVQSNLRTMYEQDEAVARKEYADHLDRIENYLADPAHSVSQVPFDSWRRLKPEDQQRLLQAQRQEDELGVREEIARNPAVLTHEWLEKNRSRMTRQTYIGYVELLSKPDAERTIKDISLDAEQVNAALVQGGYPDLVNPSVRADKEASLMLRERIKEMMYGEMQLRTKRGQAPDLDWKAKQEIIDRAVMARRKSQGWFSVKDAGMIATMSADEIASGTTVGPDGEETKIIPTSMYQYLSDKLLDARRPADNQSIVRLWMQMGMPRDAPKE